MHMNVGRELLQARILGEITRRSMKNRMGVGGLALKGGMAMRAAYGSVRHTKDIDIAADSSIMSQESVSKAVGGAISDALRASRFITAVKVTAPKQTDTTQRWKIEGRIGTTSVNLTVEVSRRDQFPEGTVRRVPWTPPDDLGGKPVLVDVYTMEMMAASKVDCLCNPNREAPRDLWDLAILIRMHASPPPELVARIGRDRLVAGLANLWGKVEKMDFQMARNELFPFIDQTVGEALDEAAWDEIRLTVHEGVRRWIEDTLEKQFPGTAVPGDMGARPS